MVLEQWARALSSTRVAEVPVEQARLRTAERR